MSLTFLVAGAVQVIEPFSFSYSNKLVQMSLCGTLRGLKTGQTLECQCVLNLVLFMAECSIGQSLSSG